MRKVIPAAYAVCVAAACASPAPASAAAVTTAGVYYEAQSTTCTKTAPCFVYFTLLNEPLVVQRVSCSIAFHSASAGNFTGMQLGQSDEEKNFKGGQYLAPIDFLGVNPNDVFQINVDTLHVLAGGVIPTLQLGYSDNTKADLNCTISGSQRSQ